jgi:hypothetical protein
LHLILFYDALFAPFHAFYSQSRENVYSMSLLTT